MRLLKCKESACFTTSVCLCSALGLTPTRTHARAHTHMQAGWLLMLALAWAFTSNAALSERTPKGASSGHTLESINGLVIPPHSKVPRQAAAAPICRGIEAVLAIVPWRLGMAGVILEGLPGPTCCTCCCSWSSCLHRALLQQLAVAALQVLRGERQHPVCCC
jgi:hypothetical protein